MKIQNKALLDIEGQPLRDQRELGQAPSEEAPILYVAKVLERAALAPPLPGDKPFDDKQNAERYAAAVYLHQLEIGVPFELEVDLVSALKAVIMRSYAPLVAGQMVPILEGK